MNPPTTAPPGPSRDGAAQMFNRIARRYDLLNRLISFRRDVAWRRKLIALLPAGDRLRVLDMATGTADVLLEMAPCARVTEGVGMDLAEEMLAIGREKIADANLDSRFTLQVGDAMQIPAPESSFDAVTISFGIRNVLDTEQALCEMRRVLKPGGRVLVLESSLPAGSALRRAHLAYLRHILPVIGGCISGDRAAYRYLNQTIESYPYGKDFLVLMAKAGFANVAQHPQTLGVATIYQGDRID